MKKLNILFICDLIKGQVGGAFVSTIRFAERLAKKGHKVVMISSKDSGLNSKNIETYHGIKVYRFFSIELPKGEKQYYLSLPSVEEIKHIIVKEKIDVVHFALPTVATYNAIKAARELGVKIVAHSHMQPENLEFHLPKIFKKIKIGRVLFPYLSRIYKNGEVVICPTEFSKKLVRQYNKSLKTIVVSNGVDLKVFKKKDSTDFLGKYRLNKSRKRALFVGRIHPEKNIATLIKSVSFVLKKFDDFEVIIVGAGYQREDLEKLSRELGVENNVKFLGKLSDEELVMAYSSADFFVMPSFVELEGMVVLEAMACGLPIIVANSKDSASRHFVKKNGFLFKPKNYKQLSKKILKILKNDNQRKKFASESLKLAKKYDISKSVEKLEKIYYSI